MSEINQEPECQDSPNGLHSFTEKNWDDPTGKTFNCVFCGESDDGDSN